MVSAAPTSWAAVGFLFRVGDRDRARPGGVRHLDRHQPYPAHTVHHDRFAERDAGKPRGVDDGHPAAGEERRGLEGDGVGEGHEVLGRRTHHVGESARQREAELADGIGAERLPAPPALRAAPAAHHVVDGHAVTRRHRAAGGASRTMPAASWPS